MIRIRYIAGISVGCRECFPRSGGSRPNAQCAKTEARGTKVKGIVLIPLTNIRLTGFVPVCRKRFVSVHAE
jgi:hypothetical protein